MSPKRSAATLAVVLLALAGCAREPERPRLGAGAASASAEMADAREADAASLDEPCDPVVAAPGRIVTESDMTSGERIEMAIGLASVPKLRRLLASGAQFDVRLSDGWRPHELAALYGHAEVVRLLYAERNGLFDDEPAFVRALLDGGNSGRPEPTLVLAGDRDRAGLTALHWSALLGEVSFLADVIKKGDVNARDAWGQTALFLAIDVRSRPLRSDSPAVDREIVRSAMIEGDLISDRDTPVEYNRGVAMLLDAGADANAVCDRKGRPIFRAIAGGHRIIFERLLSRQLELNCTDNFGNTPLHIAVSVDSGAQDWFVTRLLNEGADTTRKNEAGDTAFDLASKDQNATVVKILRGATASGN